VKKAGWPNIRAISALAFCCPATTTERRWPQAGMGGDLIPEIAQALNAATVAALIAPRAGLRRA
jgi:hypothetical protein